METLYVSRHNVYVTTETLGKCNLRLPYVGYLGVGTHKGVPLGFGRGQLPKNVSHKRNTIPKYDRSKQNGDMPMAKSMTPLWLGYSKIFYVIQ